MEEAGAQWDPAATQARGSPPRRRLRALGELPCSLTVTPAAGPGVALGPRRSVQGEARDTRGRRRMARGRVGLRGAGLLVGQERKDELGTWRRPCTGSGPCSLQGLLLPLWSPARDAHSVGEGPRSSEQTRMPPIPTL